MEFNDFCSFINKLKTKQIQFEKHESDFLKLIKSNYGVDAEEQREQLKILRKQEFSNVHKEVHQNIVSLKSIQSMISIENIKNIDLNDLKTTVISLEDNINTLKTKLHSDLEKLKKEEHNLSTDLINIEFKINDLNKNQIDTNQIVSNQILSYQNKLKTEDDYLYQEVKDFAEFTDKSGGHQGGWSKDDHLTFLKIYQKYKNENTIVSMLRNILPDLSEEIIIAHIKWYRTYLDLRSKQREAIEKWRQNKINKESKVEEQKQNIKCNDIKVSKDMKENETVVKEKIREWKLEKIQKIEKQTQTQLEDLTKVKEYENQKRLKQAEIKQQVEKWRNSKSAQERATHLEIQVQELKTQQKRILLANKLIREYQEQDSFYINERIEKLRYRIAAKEKKLNDEKMSNRNLANKDPDRIFKSTKNWSARVLSGEKERRQNVVVGYMPLKSIPKLAVPDWRKSLKN